MHGIWSHTALFTDGNMKVLRDAEICRNGTKTLVSWLLTWYNFHWKEQLPGKQSGKGNKNLWAMFPGFFLLAIACGPSFHNTPPRPAPTPGSPHQPLTNTSSPRGTDSPAPCWLTAAPLITPQTQLTVTALDNTKFQGTCSVLTLLEISFI